MPPSESVKQSSMPPGFAIISAGVINHVLRHMSGPQVRVYTALLSYAPRIFPSQKTLADKLGYAQRAQVGEVLDQLEYVGLIQRRRRYPKGYNYTVPRLENDTDAKAVATALHDFNQMKQKGRRAAIKEWKESKPADEHHADQPQSEGCSELPQDQEVGCSEQRSGSLQATTEGRSEPTQRVQVNEDKRVGQELGPASAASSFSSKTDTTVPRTRVSTAAEGKALPLEEVARVTSITTDPMTGRINVSTVGGYDFQMPEILWHKPIHELSDENIGHAVYDMYYDSLFFPWALPTWLQDIDLFHHSHGDDMLNASKALMLVNYPNMANRYLEKLMPHREDGQPHPGWINAGSWTPYRVKNAIWNAVLRYPDAIDQEYKIKSIVLKIIEKDPPDRFDVTSRLNLVEAAAWGMQVQEFFGKDESFVANKVIGVMEEYVQRLAYLYEQLYALTDIFMERGTKNVPGEIRMGARFNVKLAAFKAHYEDVLAWNPKGDLLDPYELRIPGGDYPGFTPRYGDG